MSPQATLSLAIAQASRYFVRLEMPTSAGIFIRLSFLLLNLTVTLDDKFLRAEYGRWYLDSTTFEIYYHRRFMSMRINATAQNGLRGEIWRRPCDRKGCVTIDICKGGFEHCAGNI